MEIVVRAAIIYVFLFLVLRVVGKKELSGMSAFELVVLVVMGDLVQQGVTQADTSLTAAMLAISTMMLMMVGASYLQYRFTKMGSISEGLPVIVVRDGKLQRKAMDIERLREEVIVGEARQQGIADIRDIVIGVLEPDGTFSFVTRSGDSQGQHGQEPPAT